MDGFIKVLVERHNAYLDASRNPKFCGRVAASKTEVYIELEYILRRVCKDYGLPCMWYYDSSGYIRIHGDTE